MAKKILTVVIAFAMLVTPLAIFTGCGGDDGGQEKPETSFFYPLLNGGFDTGVDSVPDYEWDIYNYNTETAVDTAVKNEGEASLRSTSVIGGYVSVWQVIPIKGKEYAPKFQAQMNALEALESETVKFPEIGDKVQFSVDVRMDSVVPMMDFSGMKVQVKSENQRKVPTIIAESVNVTLKSDEWVTIEVAPKNNNGIIPEDSVLIVVSFSLDIEEDAVLNFDNAVAGCSERGGTGGGDGPSKGQTYDSFESRGEMISVPNYDFEDGSPLVNSLGKPVATVQDGYYGEKAASIPAGSFGRFTAPLAPNSVNLATLSAGGYVYLGDTAVTGKVTLTLSLNVDGEYVDVTSAETSEISRWVYLKLPLIEQDKTGLAATHVRVTVTNSTSTAIKFDFLQIGDWQRFNGNKLNTAVMAYQPWFQNPEFAGGNTWGNWAYNATQAGGRNYDPATIVDGKRDIASVYYPLIGTYDSGDIEVIRYHIRLLKAMNIDVVQANYYADLNPYMLNVVDKMMQVCEEENMKFSILYEPKIHLNGWIPHSSRELSIKAMGEDLVKFIKKYQNNKALLLYNGQPMVEVFGINQVSGNEWKTIIDAVKAGTGFTPVLMGDGLGSIDHTNTTSLFQWNLWAPQLANPSYQTSVDFCKNMNGQIVSWVEANAYSKLGVGLVYPGFDDTPVRSWGSGPNSAIRKIGTTGPNFYNASWDAFESMKSSFDWVIVATFNDWTEGTIIEPTVQHGHELALITANRIAAYKGISAITSETLEAITEAYLQNRTTNYI